MTFDADLACIAEVVRRDPSFGEADEAAVAQRLDQLRTDVSREDFLLSAMRLLALPKNGHTRLIPNCAIKVLPMRFVALGSSFVLSEGEGPLGAALVSVNEVPVAEIFARATSYLAGVPARQRVIGALLFAWPAALRRVGVPVEGSIRFAFSSENIDVPVAASVPALEVYPQNEHGQAAASWVPEAYATVLDLDDGIAIRLPSFFDPDGQDLKAGIAAAVDALASRAKQPLLIDVRGNTGGDFLKTLPLIEAVVAHGEIARVTLLVDKFTFSAAIVFVAILKHRLGDRLRLMGEAMGDGLRFFAEGGLMELPNCRASVRYSSALHDWERGVPDKTTPLDIAAQLVAVGQLDIDVPYIASWHKMQMTDRDYSTVFQMLRG